MKMTGDSSRPFYRIGSRLFLGPIPRSDFAAFLATGFESGGFDAHSNAISAILELAEDVPYNVQRLAYECWNLLRDSAGDSLTRDDVEGALERLVRRDDPFYTQTWNSLVSTQQRALLAIVSGGGHGMLSNDVLTAHGIPVSTMQTAVAALVKRGIARQVEPRGLVLYRLEDPFLAAWVNTFVAPIFRP